MLWSPDEITPGAAAVIAFVPFRNCSYDCLLAPRLLPRGRTTCGREDERTKIDEEVERKKLRRSVSGSGAIAQPFLPRRVRSKEVLGVHLRSSPTKVRGVALVPYCRGGRRREKSQRTLRRPTWRMPRARRILWPLARQRASLAIDRDVSRVREEVEGLVARSR